jgi:hypothetical protein
MDWVTLLLSAATPLFKYGMEAYAAYKEGKLDKAREFLSLAVNETTAKVQFMMDMLPAVDAQIDKELDELFPEAPAPMDGVVKALRARAGELGGVFAGEDDAKANK